MSKHEKMIAIAWAKNCVRSSLYAERLGCPLYKVHYGTWKSKSRLNALYKYPIQLLKTWQILWQKRPKAVYVATSPVFAPLSVYVYCALTGSKMVMDVHGNAFSGHWAWSKGIHRWLASRIIASIVDQEWRKALFESWSGTVFLLPRPPLTIQHGLPDTSSKYDHFRVTVVNTFNLDEPLEPILEAAMVLPDVHFFILGSLEKAPPKLLLHKSPNVFFTDYLTGDAYWEQLASSHAVMTLTTMPYSLLGGAQEGLFFYRPVIISDQPSLHDYFGDTAVYVQHTSESIAQAIQYTQQNEEELRLATRQLANEKQALWESEFEQLTTLLEQQS